MNKEEEFNQLIVDITNLDEYDFKGWLECLKKVRELWRLEEFRAYISKDDNKDRLLDIIVLKTRPLALYDVGTENNKDNKGQPVNTGLFYSNLSEDKKKEFLEVAHEWLTYQRERC